MRSHLYADDTQLYMSFDSTPVSVLRAAEFINRDLDELSRAANLHSLQLNPSKSQYILFCNANYYEHVNRLLSIKLNGVRLSASEEVKSLGIMLDKNLNFASHVSKCVKNAYFNLKFIFQNRELLNTSVKKQMCEAIVLSHLNYGDVLYGPHLRQRDMQRVQKVQNSCLRLIYGVPRSIYRISHRLRDAEWLNMSARRKMHTL